MPARPVITPELYDSLLIAYREVPGNAANAAREAGTSRPVAKRAWEKGWAKFEYAKPIREVLRTEINTAKAERHRLRTLEEQKQEEIRAKAQNDSIDTIREEAMGSMAVRKNSLAVQGIVGTLLTGLQPLAKRLINELQSDTTLKPSQVVKLIIDIIAATKQGGEAVRTAFDLERIRLGEPTQILGLASTEDITAEEAVQELLSLSKTLERARATPLQRFGAHRTLPNGTTIIDLPQDAFEEEPAQIIPFPHKASKEE